MTVVAAAGRTLNVAREIRLAWLQYLSETRLLDKFSYAEVEPWAWERLQRTLRDLETRA